MKVLITGAGGFVGNLAEEMFSANEEPHLSVVLTSRSKGRAGSGRTIHPLDIVDANQVDEAIMHFQPDCVLHLAGISSLDAAEQHKNLAWDVNVIGTLNVARAILSHRRNCRMIFAGSGQVYGRSLSDGKHASESMLLAPDNEYAVTKAAADLALGQMANNGLDVVRFRPFNHIGPGQSADFVFPNFCKQIAQIERGDQAPVIKTGDLRVIRSFLDARDVVSAYLRAMTVSSFPENGPIYNLASDHPRSIQDGLEYLLSIAKAKIAIEQDKSRMRPDEVKRISISSEKAKEDLSWKQTIDLESCLEQILDYWRRRLAATN